MSKGRDAKIIRLRQEIMNDPFGIPWPHPEKLDRLLKLVEQRGYDAGIADGQDQA